MTHGRGHGRANGYRQSGSYALNTLQKKTGFGGKKPQIGGKWLPTRLLRVQGVRTRPSCGKSPRSARLMASSPLGSRATGAVVDVAVGGDRAAPHCAVGLHAPRSAATFRVLRDGLWAGQQVRRTQDASERMPWDSLHAALRAPPHSCALEELRCALGATSAHAKRRGGSARSNHWQRAGTSALRMTFEHECAHVCRPSEYASVISVISMYQMYGLHTLRVAAIDFTLPVLTPCFQTGFRPASSILNVSKEGGPAVTLTAKTRLRQPQRFSLDLSTAVTRNSVRHTLEQTKHTERILRPGPALSSVSSRYSVRPGLVSHD